MAEFDFSGVEERIQEAIDLGDPPGAVLAVSRGDRTVYRKAFGYAELGPACRKMQAETIFDVASLTKPVATATALMILAGRERLALDRPVGDILPEYGRGEKPAVTLRHLLANCSGLPAWKPYFLSVFGESEIPAGGFAPSPRWRRYCLARAAEEPLACAPGQVETYSDIGYMVLGSCVERISGEPLDRFCRREIFDPLQMENTFFIDLANRSRSTVGLPPERFAATEDCPRRGRLLVGEVHDENAFVMGGVAGHAGLFSTAEDLCVLARTLLLCARDGHPLVPGRIVREFWTLARIVPDGTWALGWDTPTPGRSSSGRTFSAQAVGHTGFTGTSLWIDPDRDFAVVLLTNRVHPSRAKEEGIRRLRPDVHDRVTEAVESKTINRLRRRE